MGTADLLEAVPQGELDHTRIRRFTAEERVRDHTSGRTPKAVIGNCKRRVIEHVEDIRSELELGFVERYREVLEQRHIYLVEPGPFDRDSSPGPEWE